MDHILKNYLRNLLVSYGSTNSNIVNVKIPMVYNFNYNELYRYIHTLVPCKLLEDHIDMHDLTYNYKVIFIK